MGLEATGAVNSEGTNNNLQGTTGDNKPKTYTGIELTADGEPVEMHQQPENDTLSVSLTISENSYRNPFHKFVDETLAKIGFGSKEQEPLKVYPQHKNDAISFSIREKPYRNPFQQSVDGLLAKMGIGQK